MEIHSFKFRFLTCSVLVLICSVNAWAQKPHFKEKRSAKRIQKHITYLASDALEGRLSGSPEDEISARYIANEFAKIGLLPAGEQGDFYQYMPTPDLRIAQSGTKLTLGSEQLKLFTEFYRTILKSTYMYRNYKMNLSSSSRTIFIIQIFYFKDE